MRGGGFSIVKQKDTTVIEQAGLLSSKIEDFPAEHTPPRLG